MKRIIIICEGETEQEFCKSVLVKHFISLQIEIQRPLIKKTSGGIVAWENLRIQIEKHLKEDNTAFVTTLIDFYGINLKHKFPEWLEAEKIFDKIRRLDFIEERMKLDINKNLNWRFIPYIQLHEFEGLLFNDITFFHLPKTDFNNFDKLKQIIESNPNPELINDSPETAPSKQLQNLIKGYNKVVYGAEIAEAIGIERIRAKAPRFNNWIITLENL